MFEVTTSRTASHHFSDTIFQRQRFVINAKIMGQNVLSQMKISARRENHNFRFRPCYGVQNCVLS